LPSTASLPAEFVHHERSDCRYEACQIEAGPVRTPLPLGVGTGPRQSSVPILRPLVTSDQWPTCVSESCSFGGGVQVPAKAKPVPDAEGNVMSDAATVKSRRY
jgi:hypothetical protein